MNSDELFKVFFLTYAAAIGIVLLATIIVVSLKNRKK